MGGHHTCCNKQKVKRGLWSPEEDEKLVNYISNYGHGCWSTVPRLAGLQRCGKSCRLRWINYLRPDLKRGTFSPQEAALIIELHRILGNKWAQIAKHLPGRTDNEVKNFWNSSIKKKLVQASNKLSTTPNNSSSENIILFNNNNIIPNNLIMIQQSPQIIPVNPQGFEYDSMHQNVVPDLHLPSIWPRPDFSSFINPDNFKQEMEGDEENESLSMFGSNLEDYNKVVKGFGFVEDQQFLFQQQQIQDLSFFPPPLDPEEPVPPLQPFHHINYIESLMLSFANSATSSQALPPPSPACFVSPNTLPSSWGQLRP